MAEYYVNPTTGNDTTGSGTSGSPWATVDKANAESTVNDEIIIQSGTHTVTTLTMDEARTYRGELSSTGKILTTLDFNGAFTSGAGASNVEDFGPTGGSMAVKDMKVINHNTTDLNVWRYAFGRDTDGEANSTTVNFENVVFDNWALGHTTNTFTGSIFHLRPTSLATYNFTKCSFLRMSRVAGASSAFLLTTNQRVLQMNFDRCVVQMHPISGTGLSAIYSTNSNNTSAGLSVDRTILYSTSGSHEISNNQTSNLDVDNASNVFFGTYTSPSTSNPVTSDPLFVDLANQNVNLQPDSPAKGIGAL